MKPNKLLAALASLEKQLKAASPSDAGKIAKKIVSLTDEWINQ